MSKETDTLTVEWCDKAAKFLVGKTIKNVRYATDREKQSLMLHEKPVIIEFTDGHSIFPMSDCEGNDAGVLFTTCDNLPVIPNL